MIFFFNTFVFYFKVYLADPCVNDGGDIPYQDYSVEFPSTSNISAFLIENTLTSSKCLSPKFSIEKDVTFYAINS